MVCGELCPVRRLPTRGMIEEDVREGPDIVFCVDCRLLRCGSGGQQCYIAKRAIQTAVGCRVAVFSRALLFFGTRMATIFAVSRRLCQHARYRRVFYQVEQGAKG